MPRRFSSAWNTWSHVAAVLLSLVCCGCATYQGEEQRALVASTLEEKLQQAEWRIILFRWPPEDTVVMDGVTNRLPRPFVPYFHGFSTGQGDRW